MIQKHLGLKLNMNVSLRIGVGHMKAPCNIIAIGIYLAHKLYHGLRFGDPDALDLTVNELSKLCHTLLASYLNDLRQKAPTLFPLETALARLTDFNSKNFCVIPGGRPQGAALSV